jgi:hypothetical protein
VTTVLNAAAQAEFVRRVGKSRSDLVVMLTRCAGVVERSQPGHELAAVRSFEVGLNRMVLDLGEGLGDLRQLVPVWTAPVPRTDRIMVHLISPEGGAYGHRVPVAAARPDQTAILRTDLLDVLRAWASLVAARAYEPIVEGALYRVTTTPEEVDDAV